MLYRRAGWINVVLGVWRMKARISPLPRVPPIPLVFESAKVQGRGWVFPSVKFTAWDDISGGDKPLPYVV